MFSPLSLQRAAALTIAFAALALAGPCDIYSSGGTPCVAAHSTTRSLYDAFTGPLYQVRRGSDDATINIDALSPGGVANSEAQDSFCANTTCVISTIFDQSSRGNHLTRAPPGGAAAGPAAGGFDTQASAIGAPVTLNGHKAYGVFIHPTSGYRNNAASGTAIGDSAEGMYAIVDGTHYNDKCCFDYGNAERNSRDNNNGHMEAIYFGNAGRGGTGNGPWVLADLENGLFSGGNRGINPFLPSSNSQFITAVVKGEPGRWSIRAGNSTAGSLTTHYTGSRPAGGYSPMKKEGAIILGIGGDNSDGSQGTFYEGVMTSGYPSDATEDSVQANIVAAGYAKASLIGGSKYAAGSSISIRATTACCTSDYITHSGSAVSIQQLSSASPAELKQRASWKVRAGLANNDCISFESQDWPGNFLRHSNFELHLNHNDGSKLFAEDATYCTQSGLSKGISIRSYSFPNRYFRHYNGSLYVASNGGFHEFDSKRVFNEDVSWIIDQGFA